MAGVSAPCEGPADQARCAGQARPARRAVCSHCALPLPACLCRHIRPSANRWPVLLLQHPQEAAQAKGSARLLRLGLAHCRLEVGERFDDAQLRAWLSNAAAGPGRAALALPRPGPRRRPRASGACFAQRFISWRGRLAWHTRLSRLTRLTGMVRLAHLAHPAHLAHLAHPGRPALLAPAQRLARRGRVKLAGITPARRRAAHPGAAGWQLAPGPAFAAGQPAVAVAAALGAAAAAAVSLLDPQGASAAAAVHPGGGLPGPGRARRPAGVLRADAGWL